MLNTKPSTIVYFRHINGESYYVVFNIAVDMVISTTGRGLKISVENTSGVSIKLGHRQFAGIRQRANVMGDDYYICEMTDKVASRLATYLRDTHDWRCAGGTIGLMKAWDSGEDIDFSTIRERIIAKRRGNRHA